MRKVGIVCAALVLTGCVASLRDTMHPSMRNPPSGQHWVFTDGDLDELLASAPSGGLIYVWSPHMPYSVKGLREIERVGARSAVPVIPLLDPQADTELSESVTHQAELPHAALRYLHSRRLFERGATLHFPTLIVFARGRIADHMLPGYTSPAVYEAFIEKQLAQMLHQDVAQTAQDAHRFSPQPTRFTEHSR